ncbi:MAG: hypothetical protein ACRDZV_12170 [Acidimicrobiia bacterium]
MAETVDRIVDLIDDAFQSSDEGGHTWAGDPDLCTRCTEYPPGEASDFCAGCRAFLLGDSDDDPAAVARAIEDVVGRALWITVQFTISIEAFGAAMQRVAEQIAEDMKPLGITAGAPPDDRAMRARREEADMLDRLRRSQRRTNRWGMPARPLAILVGVLRWYPANPGSNDLHGFQETGTGAWFVGRVISHSDDGGEFWAGYVMLRRIPGRFATRDEAQAAVESAWALVPQPYQPWPRVKRWRPVPNSPGQGRFEDRYEIRYEIRGYDGSPPAEASGAQYQGIATC